MRGRGGRVRGRTRALRGADPSRLARRPALRHGRAGDVRALHARSGATRVRGRGDDRVTTSHEGDWSPTQAPANAIQLTVLAVIADEATRALLPKVVTSD